MTASYPVIELCMFASSLVFYVLIVLVPKEAEFLGASICKLYPVIIFTLFLLQICVYCQKKGATVTCARVIGSQMRRCEMNYHFSCAIKANCVFFKDKVH